MVFNLYKPLKRTLIFMHTHSSTRCLFGLWLIYSGWQGQRGPGICSHRDLGRNVRLPPHLRYSSSSGDCVANITALPTQHGLAHKEAVSHLVSYGANKSQTTSHPLYFNPSCQSCLYCTAIYERGPISPKESPLEIVNSNLINSSFWANTKY